jgi:hypothetical protein
LFEIIYDKVYLVDYASIRLEISLLTMHEMSIKQSRHGFNSHLVDHQGLRATAKHLGVSVSS